MTTTPSDPADVPLIVVGVDGSEAALHALDWAIAEGARRGAIVTLVHVYQDPHYRQYADAEVDTAAWVAAAQSVLDAAVEHAASFGSGPPIEAILTSGHPAKALVDASANADLLVVGASAHGGLLATLLGSVSESVFHHATCPVVAVPRRSSVSQASTR